MDDRVPERRDSHASSSHGPSLEPTRTRSVDLGKHSVFTHFPKDRNCEICQRTKITRAPCRRRIGGAVPRAENFGDLITADHIVKVVNLETIIDMQSFCRTWSPMDPVVSVQNKKLLKEHKGACKSSWSRIGSQKSFTLTIPWNVAKLVKIFHCTSTPYRSETNGIPERAVRKVKEGTSAVLLQSGLAIIFCEIVDGRPCGIDTLIQHMRRVVFSLDGTRIQRLISPVLPLWRTFVRPNGESMM